MSVSDNSTYRVEIAYDTKQVKVSCFGMMCIDKDAEGHYDSVDELPEWMQERLATLSLLHVPPPKNDIENIGCRIGPFLYWVYK